LNPPTTGVLASAKALEAIVPPLVVTTIGMPEPIVWAPDPPTFLIVSRVVPVAVPPLTMIWSAAEPDPPSAAFMTIPAPVPR
jgi:hypothetical protein